MSTIKAIQEEALLNRLTNAAHEVLSPPPTLRLSEWAEQRLYLSPEASALPGRFRFERACYQRDVFDALSDSDIRKVVIMAASQTMKTQSILTFIGFIIDLDPAPVLVVQPTLKMAKTFSKDRIDTMLRDVSSLKGKVADKRERDGGNTAMHKVFAGGALTIATANSPSDLAARPIRYLFFDEVDRYEPTTEGDPVEIAEKRTTTYWNSKEVLVSSPGDEEISRIAKEYEKSDKRVFMVPCHSCGAEQQLTWKGVKWLKGQPETARYECEHCQTMWDDIQRNTNVSYGRWVRTNPSSKVAGFHISAMYSSFITLPELAAEHLSAKDDNEQRKVFINTRLAETWKNDATTVSDINWLNRLEAYTPQTLPDEVLLITAGVDVQIDRIEAEVVGWGIGDESWSIEYLVIMGDPTSQAPWDQLGQHLGTVYRRNDGTGLKINATCVDTGGTATQDVINFARNHKNNVFPIKGVAGQGRAIFLKRAARFRTGSRYYQVGVDQAKVRLYQQLQIEKPGIGYCHFPNKYDDYYFDGLTSEKYVVKYKRGHPYKVWFKKPNVRNEPLDCRVYAMAARFSITLDMKKRSDALQQKAAERKDTKVVEEVAAPDNPITHYNVRKPPTRRSGGYVSGLNIL